MSENNHFPPLSEPKLYILISLEQGPKHGYQLGKDIEELSHGKVRMAVGNLYQALKQLLDRKLITRVEKSRSGGSRVKTYKITDLGREALLAEQDRLAFLLDVASRKSPTPAKGAARSTQPPQAPKSRRLKLKPSPT